MEIDDVVNLSKGTKNNFICSLKNCQIERIEKFY